MEAAEPLPAQLFGEFDLSDQLDHRESMTNPALRPITAGLSEESNLVLGLVTLGHCFLSIYVVDFKGCEKLLTQLAE